MVAKFKSSKKGNRQTVFFSVLIGFLLVLVVGFLIFSNFKIAQRRTELTNRIENLKKEIQILENKNQTLQAGIIQTESEDFQKGKLYEQGYIEKGATQVVVLQEQEEVKVKQRKNLWQKFLESFGLIN